MNPLSIFFAFIARRRAARIHAAQVRRAEIIRQQIGERKAKHRAWRYLEGELRACNRIMLECELILSGRSAGRA